MTALSGTKNPEMFTRTKDCLFEIPVNVFVMKINAWKYNTENLFAGQFCGSAGLTAPTGNCSAGYYCPGGQNTSSPLMYVCSPGHYCPEGSATEQACPPGLYQDEFGKVSSLEKFCKA